MRSLRVVSPKKVEAKEERFAFCSRIPDTYALLL